MTGKFGKWLGKHDVQYYQTTRGIWKHSGNIRVLLDMANGRMLWQVTENYKIRR